MSREACLLYFFTYKDCQFLLSRFRKVAYPSEKPGGSGIAYWGNSLNGRQGLSRKCKAGSVIPGGRQVIWPQLEVSDINYLLDIFCVLLFRIVTDWPRKNVSIYTDWLEISKNAYSKITVRNIIWNIIYKLFTSAELFNTTVLSRLNSYRLIKNTISWVIVV